MHRRGRIRAGKIGFIGLFLIVMALAAAGKLIAVGRRPPDVGGVPAASASTSPFRPGDAIRIVRGPDEHGEVPRTISVIRQGDGFVRVANPTRATIVDGRIVPKGRTPTVEVEIAEGESSGLRVWTNAAADCLVPAGGR